MTSSTRSRAAWSPPVRMTERQRRASTRSKDVMAVAHRRSSPIVGSRSRSGSPSRARTTTSRSASRHGDGRRRNVSTTLNIAVFTPMATARVAMTPAPRAGRRRSARAAYRRSPPSPATPPFIPPSAARDRPRRSAIPPRGTSMQARSKRRSAAAGRRSAKHLDLIEAADLQYPIILAADGRVMDGMHRVARAMRSGATDIEAVRFDADPPPDHIGKGPDDLPYPDSG